MRHLLFISIFMFWGCSSQYKSLITADGNVYAIQKFKPDFKSTLYQAFVNVAGKHLSGLLLIKTMENGNTRIVFSNEMGIKYFDFEFATDGKFTVHFILEKMNRKAVISTLKEDFELILMLNLDYNKAFILKNNESLYFVFQDAGEFRYYITDHETKKLEGIESGTKNKRKVKAQMFNYTENVPDSISIEHCNFNLNISLKRLIR